MRDDPPEAGRARGAAETMLDAPRSVRGGVDAPTSYEPRIVRPTLSGSQKMLTSSSRVGYPLL
jgi:hypothetical protein